MPENTGSDAYAALRGTCALIDLSARGRIRVTGEDRARLLHAMATNHVQGLGVGEGCYAFFLTAQGRIMADAYILRREDDLLLDTEPETRERLPQFLDQYIIVDDVALEDVTEATACLAVEGPAAADALARAGAPVPEADHAHVSWGASRRVARLSATGLPGFWIYADAADRETLMAELALPLADADAVRVLRLEQRHARYGEDFSERYLPHETGLLHALHFQKGCYLGQEIVERVRSRGLVHRRLVALRVDGTVVPAHGAKLQADGKDVGEITSAVYSPAEGATLALGYVRTEHARAGASLTVDGEPVTVTEAQAR